MLIVACFLLVSRSFATAAAQKKNPKKMATPGYDVVESVVAAEEHANSNSFKETQKFALSECRCVRVIQRQCDASLKETVHAFENVLALIVGEKLLIVLVLTSFGKQTSFDIFLDSPPVKKRKLSTRSVRINTNFAAMVVLLLRVIGKKFTSLFRHDSILKTEMYSNGSVETRRLFDCLGNNVHPWHQFIDRRLFASFSNGNNKQRFFVEVVLRQRWVLDENPLAWIIYIGCNQGHSTKSLPRQVVSSGNVFSWMDFSRHRFSLREFTLQS